MTSTQYVLTLTLLWAVILLSFAPSRSLAESERIAIRSREDAAALDEIRASLKATRVRTLSDPTIQVWELPPEVGEDEIERIRADDRLQYVQRLEGSERQIFTEQAVSADLSPNQSRMIQKLRGKPTTAQFRTVRLQAAQFTVDNLESAVADKQPLILNLFDGKGYEAVGHEIRRRKDGFTWYGVLPDAGGRATLVVRGDNITGTINVGREKYSITPLGGGVHAIVEVDQTKFPDEHPPQFDEIEKGTQDVPPTMLDSPGPGATGPATEAQLDVLVLYPNTLLSTDVPGLIQLAVDETNESYEESRIHAALRVVHAESVSYQPSGSIWRDLDALKNGTGSLAIGHTRRDEHKADIVVLMVDQADACGVAGDILASPDTAFAVVREDCATGYYSFGHEIGHLLGARHDPCVDPTASPFRHGHGHLTRKESVAGGSWWDRLRAWVSGSEGEAVERTIMGYATCCEGCPRIQRWSNPELDFEGRQLGTEELSNNVGVINQTAQVVESFRN